MIPIQCGAPDRSLLALYDPPTSAPERSAVLICYPWAGEYFTTYGLMRGLAARLCDDGHHVLRFDYFGSGDSDGVFTDGDLEGWTEDAGVALEELLLVSAKRSATVVGARAGALVASRLAAMRDEVDRLVFWDPVLAADTYFAGMASASAGTDRAVPSGWPLGEDGTTVVLDGFPFTQALGRSALESPVDPSQWRRVRSCLVVATAASEETYQDLSDRAAEHGVPSTTVTAPVTREERGRLGDASFQKALHTIVAALR